MFDNIPSEMYSPGKHNFQEPGKIETHNSDFADKQKLTKWDEWHGLANIFVLEKFQVGNSFYKFFVWCVYFSDKGEDFQKLS